VDQRLVWQGAPGSAAVLCRDPWACALTMYTWSSSLPSRVRRTPHPQEALSAAADRENRSEAGLWDLAGRHRRLGGICRGRSPGTIQVELSGATVVARFTAPAVSPDDQGEAGPAAGQVYIFEHQVNDARGLAGLCPTVSDTTPSIASTRIGCPAPGSTFRTVDLTFCRESGP
jgi:hypothetical protein